MKLDILKQIIAHLNKSQGMDLHDRLQESRKPKPVEAVELEVEPTDGMPKENFNDKANSAIAEISKRPGMEDEAEESAETPEVEAIETAKPDGQEITDEELEELLSKLVK